MTVQEYRDYIAAGNPVENGSVGTLFAMVYVGGVVRFVNRHLGWFDRILAYKPGFRRYVYGLARYIKHY